MRLRLGELQLRGDAGEITAVFSHLLQHHGSQLTAVLSTGEFPLEGPPAARKPHGVLVPICSADDAGAITPDQLSERASQALVQLSGGGYQIHSATIAFPAPWQQGSQLWNPGGMLQTAYGPLVMVPWGGFAECCLHAVVSQ